MRLLDLKTLTTFSTRLLVKVLRRLIYATNANKFKSLIPLRGDLGDLRISAQVNSASVLFSQGAPESLKRVLQRYKADGVTFFGALTAEVVVAAKRSGAKCRSSSRWTLRPTCASA